MNENKFTDRRKLKIFVNKLHSQKQGRDSDPNNIPVLGGSSDKSKHSWYVLSFPPPLQYEIPKSLHPENHPWVAPSDDDRKPLLRMPLHHGYAAGRRAPSASFGNEIHRCHWEIVSPRFGRRVGRR